MGDISSFISDDVEIKKLSCEEKDNMKKAVDQGHGAPK